MSGTETTHVNLDALASAAGVPPSQDAIEPIKQGLTQIVLEPAQTPSVSINDREGDHDDASHSSYSASSHSHHSRHSLPAPFWTHRVSASFNAMAEQIAAASQAIACIPPLPDSMFAQLSSRMDDIERTQSKIESEFSLLRDAMGKITEGPEKFQKALDVQISSFKLEQSRLPGRLHNALVTVAKMPIKAIPMANGKTPQNFPATRGEFEHLTKERYEFLMKAYDIPIPADADRTGKREILRSFIGLPQ